MHEFDKLVLDIITRLSLGADPVQVRAVVYAAAGLAALKVSYVLARWGGAKGWTAARASWRWARTPRPISRECQALLTALDRATFHPSEVTPCRTSERPADELRAGLLVARVEHDGYVSLRLDTMDPLTHLAPREQKQVVGKVRALVAHHRGILRDVERSLVLDTLTEIAGGATLPVPSGRVRA